MPVLGTGIIPSGVLGAELQAVTRRAFIPRLITQIYKSTPLMSALLSRADIRKGGVSGVEFPVQGAAMTTPGWSDYSGSFTQPQLQNGIQNGTMNLKLMITPIPFLGMESVIQDGAEVINLLEARTADAGRQILTSLTGALYGNTTNNQQLIGLPAVADDGTNVANYANINRAANAWWQAKYFGAAGAHITRDWMLAYINSLVKNCGEAPSFAVMGFGTWTALAQDFTASERYTQSPGQGFGAHRAISTHFRALDVAGVPFYADPYCPEGVIYLLNREYLSLSVHEKGAFSFTGFESTLPNFQLGYVGAVLNILELVCTSPRTQCQVAGLTGYVNI